MEMTGRILVADDDENIRRLLRRFLTDRGYQVDVACDGIEALEALRRDGPDLLLLDIEMPNLGGMAVLQQIEQEGIPVAIIMISGLADEETARKSLALGAADFITKPFDFNYLNTSLAAKLMTLEF